MMSKMREPIYLISDALHIDKLKKIYYNIFIKNIKKGLTKNEKINRLSNCNIIFVNRHPAISNFFNFSIYVWNRSKLVSERRAAFCSPQKGKEKCVQYI